MAAKYWLKLYHEILDDPKMGRLPVNLKWRFVECLLMAGELDEGGYLPTVSDMAWRVRTDEETMRRDMSQLAICHMVELKDDDRWFVTHFQERQEASDAAQRMREYRSRQRKEKEAKRKENQLKEEDKEITDIDTYRTVTGVTKRNANGHIPPAPKPQYTIPEPLKGEDFEKSFIAWYKHLLEKDRPITQAGGDALLRRLATMGKVRAMAAIDHSMASGWFTVNEENHNGNGHYSGGKSGKTTNDIIDDAFAAIKNGQGLEGF